VKHEPLVPQVMTNSHGPDDLSPFSSILDKDPLCLMRRIESALFVPGSRYIPFRCEAFQISLRVKFRRVS